MIHGTLLHDMNQRNVKMQRLDRSRAPVNVPQQSYGTRVNQLKGWGTSGGVYSAMLAGFGLEFITTADFFG